MPTESVGRPATLPPLPPQASDTARAARAKAEQHYQEVAARKAGAAESAPETPLSPDAAKQALNQAVLSTSLEVSLSAGQESLALLYKTAIDNLNEVLAPEFGDNAIQRAAESGLDVSPEATAGRIVSLSTAFFGRYQDAHPEKDLETALTDFVTLIGGGVDQGFAEARKILDGLGVLRNFIPLAHPVAFDLITELHWM